MKISYISVMTEITNNKENLPQAIESFILHWGDMGGQWGVNRSVAQIHALLYVTDSPLTAEDIAEKLNLARSNVSNSIKELLSWQLIHRVPVKGDRRDHFAAETDIWEIVRRIARGRKNREIDPAEEVLKSCVQMAADDQSVDPVALQRIQQMLEFIQLTSLWHEQMLNLPPKQLMLLIKMGTKVTQLLSPAASSNSNTSAND